MLDYIIQYIYIYTHIECMVRRCRRVCPCPSVHRRRRRSHWPIDTQTMVTVLIPTFEGWKKGENKNKSLYTKRTREAAPSPPPLMLSHFCSLAMISASLSLSHPYTTRHGTSPSRDPFCCTFDAVSVQRPFIRNNITRVVVVVVVYVCDFSASFSYVILTRRLLSVTFFSDTSLHDR